MVIAAAIDIIGLNKPLLMAAKYPANVVVTLTDFIVHPVFCEHLCDTTSVASVHWHHIHEQCGRFVIRTVLSFLPPC